MRRAIFAVSFGLVSFSLLSGCGGGGSSTSNSTTPTTGAAAGGSGTATLSWMPPTSNTDGSALADLTGYRILYGQDALSLDRVISIDNPSANTYVVENLTPGTWYFGVVAVNSAGEESEPSGVGSKVIG